MNITIISLLPNASTNPTLMTTAIIGAGAALIGAAVSSYTYYFIEKRKFENETKKLLRDERKRIYSDLFLEIDEFKKTYLDRFSCPENDPSDPYGNWLSEADQALWNLNEKWFLIQLQLNGNLEIGKILRETYRYSMILLLLGVLSGQETPAMEASQKITNQNITFIKDKLGRTIRLMRAELIPLTETRRDESEREFWWEEVK